MIINNQNIRLFLFIFISITLCQTVFGQIGKYCENNENCVDDQICVVNHCACRIKNIPNGLYCFPESNFGEVCWFQDQCIHNNQICSNTSTGVQRCICDKFHQYNHNFSTCVLRPNLTDYLVERYNNFERLEQGTRITFQGISIIGLVVFGIGCFGFFAALIYCIRMYKSDKKLNDQVEMLTLKSKNKAPTAPPKQETPEEQKKLRDAGIGPILVDDLVIG